MMTVRHHRDGFTLLEVLLAVSILAIVITTVYSTWNAALTGWRRTSEVSDTFQRQRIVMETLSELTRSAVFFGSDPELYQVQGVHNETQGDSVSFVTASDALLPPNEALLGGMRRVTIALQRDPAGGVMLTLSNEAGLGGEDAAAAAPPSHVISTDVSGFGIQYLDPRDASWKDSWEDGMVVPSAIMYTVAFADPSNPKAPPLTVTRAVELPAAVGAMQLVNPTKPAQSTTNEVTKQNVPVVNPNDLTNNRQSGGEGM